MAIPDQIPTDLTIYSSDDLSPEEFFAATPNFWAMSNDTL